MHVGIDCVFSDFVRAGCWKKTEKKWRQQLCRPKAQAKRTQVQNCCFLRKWRFVFFKCYALTIEPSFHIRIIARRIDIESSYFIYSWRAVRSYRFDSWLIFCKKGLESLCLWTAELMAPSPKSELKGQRWNHPNNFKGSLLLDWRVSQQVLVSFFLGK